jgi:biopolymer transport protein ExbD
MAFGGFDNGNQQPMSEINITPLVDVMLVLLVIFMVTAPLLTHAIKIDLPQAQQRANVAKPDTITLALDARGRAFWNDQPVADADLPARFANAAQRQPRPELHLRADRNTRYQKIADVMAGAQTAGLQRMGFVTDPSVKH